MPKTNKPQIVTTAEKQAARDMERETAELNAFCSAWDLDHARCVRGIALLKRFAVTNPAGFEMAMRSNFEDPPQLKHPLFANNASWADFVRHRADCPDCSEALYGVARKYVPARLR